MDGRRPLENFEGVDDCVRFAPWTEVGNDYTAVRPSVVAEQDWQYDPHYPFAAKTSVELPLSSDLLYLVSSGSLSHGHVEITADEDSNKDVATVEVIFLYHREEILEDAKVCYLERRHGEAGVGIFVSLRRSSCRRPDYLALMTGTTEQSPRYPRRNPDHSARFAVKVTFPAKSGVLQIKGFETSLPLFTHVLDDLESKVAFKSLELRGSNSPIYAKVWSYLRVSKSRWAQ